MLLVAEAGWPRLSVVTQLGDPALTPEVVTEDRAELILKTGGRLVVDRRDGRAEYTLSRSLSDEEIVHPYLAPAAAVMAYWHGRQSFHAGAFLHDGGVWGVVGGRESGKSSMLSWLAREGFGVVTDDLLVLGATAAYAGPRSIDLRRPTAEHLGLGTALGVVGMRERWRLTLPQIAGELPFCGWIFLSWSAARPELRRLSGSACLAHLIENLGLLLPAADPARLLQLATLPAWGLARPREWRHMSESIELMLSVAAR